MNSKTLTLLGFASKAGKLSYGFDKALTSAKAKKAFLMVMSCDISEKSRKEMEFYADKYGVKTMALSDVSGQQLTGAVGKNCKALSVNDRQFADSIYISGGNADGK